MKLSIYQAVLKAYAEQQGISLEEALDVVLEQAEGKLDAEGQIEQYKKAYEELRQHWVSGLIAYLIQRTCAYLTNYPTDVMPDSIETDFVYRETTKVRLHISFTRE